MNVVQPPPNDVPLADDDGVCGPAWYLFFAYLGRMPSPIEEVVLGPSPHTFIASFPGTLLIAGGTVSQVDLTRGRVTVTTGQTAGFFPMALQDEIEITYTVLPDVWFIPS